MADKNDKTATTDAPETSDEAPKKGGRKKLVLLALPVLLIGLGAGLWFSGILPGLLGMGSHQEAAAGAEPPPPPVPQPAFVDLPEIVSNLNAPGRRASFVRLRAKLEVSRQEMWRR
jgi:flagellar FliL protein